jgi:arylsulfatase
MRANQWITSVSIAALSALLATEPALAQQTTGVPGSPDATTTVDGRYLPPPDQPFRGEINLNAAQSKPAWSRLCAIASRVQ